MFVINGKKLLMSISLIFFIGKALGCEYQIDRKSVQKASKQTQWSYALLLKFSELKNALNKTKRVSFEDDMYLNDINILDVYIRELEFCVIYNAFYDELEKKQSLFSKESVRKKFWELPWKKSVESHPQLLSESLWNSFVQKLCTSKDRTIKIQKEEDLYLMSCYYAAPLLCELTLERKRQLDLYNSSFPAHN